MGELEKERQAQTTNVNQVWKSMLEAGLCIVPTQSVDNGCFWEPSTSFPNHTVERESPSCPRLSSVWRNALPLQRSHQSSWFLGTPRKHQSLGTSETCVWCACHPLTSHKLTPSLKDLLQIWIFGIAPSEFRCQGINCKKQSKRESKLAKFQDSWRSDLDFIDLWFSHGVDVANQVLITACYL